MVDGREHGAAVVTDADRGFVATAAITPLSFVEWERDWWFVYIAGVRSGSLIAGQVTAMYRSLSGGSRMFASLGEAVAELERIAEWIVVANAEVCNKTAVYS